MEGGLMEFVVPDLEYEDVVLEPRVTRADREEDAVALEHWLKLGYPVPVALTPERTAGDEALRAFVEGDAGARYWLVHLACTFSPPDGRRLEQAWFTVRLERQDGGAPPAIAWSMTPMHLERPAGREEGVEVGAGAKFVTVKAQRKRTVEGGDTYLEAFGLQQADPVWEFTRTPTHEISGSAAFALVARCPAGGAVTGTVELTAAVRDRRNALRSVRSRVRSGDRFTFALGGSEHGGQAEL
jgi:hypothetical protein